MGVKVEGVHKLLNSFYIKAKAVDEAEPVVNVIVGYTQNYAIYVHENLRARHPVGQAKFLEQPLRELRTELKLIIMEALKRGVTILQAMLLAGLRLQRESQLLCPVDTGALRNSAFTRPE